MSPLEIPGTSINIPFPPGEQECEKCKRDFNKPKVKTEGDDIFVRCPHCNHIIKSYSKKALQGSSNEGSKKD